MNIYPSAATSPKKPQDPEYFTNKFYLITEQSSVAEKEIGWKND